MHNELTPQMESDLKLMKININDILEVFCENDESYHQARVLQIKEESKHNEKYFYIHFLNYEKRMDRWISYKEVKKVIGNFELDKVRNFHPHEYQLPKCIQITEKNVLTRKRSNMIGVSDLHHEHGENLDSAMKIKNVDKIILGYYEIEAWYYSPFPPEFVTEKVLYVCEFCLKYMKRKSTFIKHMRTCKRKCPPGIKIYHHDLISKEEEASKRTSTSISVYEIIGDEEKLFCQNLCLISKLFLDHKSIYFDVSPFKFYVLTENDEYGSHIVAYFSKEVSLVTEFNLACIMVLPPYQRKGYGQFLISMSYHLSRSEKRICTPETPLSDLGRLSYKSYWTVTLLETLLKFKGNLSIKELSEHTGIKTEDIIYTLNELSLIKYWKGQHVLQTINSKQIEEFLNQKNKGKAHHVKFISSCMINNSK